ncbi:hypothetical protein KKD19_04635, partial [Patescibacteria group bacterium]|nr:hypothetical protein [Patescibacteria group bacterium]MCG2693526.1 hypothetical protein [Candidatus Parcubacteria bacterium]
FKSGLETTSKELRQEFKSGLETTSKELRQEFKSGLETTSKELRQEFKSDIKTLRKDLVADINNLLENNIMPALDQVDTDIARLPNKEYIDNKLFDLKGEIILLHRKEEERFDLLVSFLREAKVLSDVQIKKLLEYKSPFQLS